jgi:hypothetical protein
MVCMDVGFANEENITPLISEINIIQRQINNLILKIKQDNKL